MSTAHVCTSDSEARPHVLEPFSPFSPAAIRPGRGARRALSCTQEQLDAAVREARRSGVEEGKTMVEQELLRVTNAMSEAVRRAMEEHQAAIQSLQQDAIGLSLAIARQILMSELRANPETIANVVKELLEEAEGRKIFSVTLHPDDLERIKNSEVGETLAQAGIEMRPSAEITPGGCALETGFGKLDARLETRIEEIAASLLGHGATVNDGDLEASE